MGRQDCNLLPPIRSSEQKDDSVLLHSVFVSERASTHPSPGGPRNHGYQCFALVGFYLPQSAPLFFLYPYATGAGGRRFLLTAHAYSVLYGYCCTSFEALSKPSTSLQQCSSHKRQNTTNTLSEI